MSASKRGSKRPRPGNYGGSHCGDHKLGEDEPKSPSTSPEESGIVKASTDQDATEAFSAVGLASSHCQPITEIHQYSPTDYPRRRAAIACETCRQRKTRCNGQRPKCEFCKEIGGVCEYRHAPPAPPSKTERNIDAILRKVLRIEQVLEAHVIPQFPSPATTVSTIPEPEPTASRHPIIVSPGQGNIMEDCQNTMIHRLFETNQVVHENPFWFSTVSQPVPIHLPPIMNPLYGDKARATQLFDVFFTKVHPSFPFLDRTAWLNEHMNCFDTRFLAPKCDNCVALLVIALASLAEDWRIGVPQAPLSQDCMLAAQVMLPAVVLGHDITAVYCLLLFGIYYNWIVQPPQAFNFMSMASMKLQFILVAKAWYVSLPENELAVRRAYIVCHLIENDLRLQSMNPGTRLEEYEQVLNPTKISESDEDLYLIHEYKVRSILHRSKGVRRVVTGEREFTYNYELAKQLKEELEEWFDALPPAFKFDRYFAVPGDRNPVPPYMDPRIAMLRADYFGHSIVIDWPLIELIKTGRLTSITLTEEEIVRRWITLCFRFITSLATLVDHYHPNFWIMANAIFAGTMCLVPALECPAIARLAPPYEVIVCYIASTLRALDRLSHDREVIKGYYNTLKERLEVVTNNRRMQRPLY